MQPLFALTQFFPEFSAPRELGASRHWAYICTYVCVHLIKGSASETKTSTHWSLIGRSMTTPSPVLSPSSILPHLLIIMVSLYQGNVGRFKKYYYLNSVTVLKITEIWNFVTCICVNRGESVWFLSFSLLRTHKYFVLFDLHHYEDYDHRPQISRYASSLLEYCVCAN